MKKISNTGLNTPVELLSQGLRWMTKTGLLTISIIAFLGIIAEIGFKLPIGLTLAIHLFYLFCIASFMVTILLRIAVRVFRKSLEQKVLTSEYFLFFVLIILLVLQLLIPERQEDRIVIANIVADPDFVRFSVILLFIIEVSKSSLQFQKLDINPALLFTGSFLLLILIGTMLLLLPKATTNGISLVNALFTSTSAVCVTGLVVVNTATDFTQFGQLIILVLIQIGGLGIMTFTSFFGFFFVGASSFENALFIQEFINESKISQIVRTTIKIIIFTLIFELLGGVIIYLSVLDSFDSYGEALWFSAFHTISAFCNAGFSTLSNGLYDPILRTNYTLHMAVAGMIFMGGIGFPVIFNIYNSLKYYFVNKSNALFGNVLYLHRGRHLTVHTKIVLVTTAILLLLGFAVFLWAEKDNTLKGLPWYGKLATAIFGTVTPRTAGFNTVDMTQLAGPTVLFYLILMWIGASPGSTGGGLKTTTFAVAVLNTLSIAKHKGRIEIFKRQITETSVRKAFAVILLSFLIIGLSVFFVKLFNPELRLIAVAFECFSAFSTVGLTLGITESLTIASKSIIIVTMFIGRVGTLTLLIALVRRSTTQNYQYPSETVFIT
ncbi:MAG: potassium transporter TrkG [Fulvivirga sp.]